MLDDDPTTLLQHDRGSSGRAALLALLAQIQELNTLSAGPVPATEGKPC